MLGAESEPDDATTAVTTTAVAMAPMPAQNHQREVSFVGDLSSFVRAASSGVAIAALAATSYGAGTCVSCRLTSSEKRSANSTVWLSSVCWPRTALITCVPGSIGTGTSSCASSSSWSSTTMRSPR